MGEFHEGIVNTAKLAEAVSLGFSPSLFVGDKLGCSEGDLPVTLGPL